MGAGLLPGVRYSRQLPAGDPVAGLAGGRPFSTGAAARLCPAAKSPGGHRRPQHPGVFLPAGIPCGLCLLLTAVSRYTLPALTVPLLVVTAMFAALLVGAYNGWRKEGIWLQNGRLTLRWQHGFHLHDICVLCPVPALTAMQSPWAAAVHRTNLTLTFPGRVKCRVRSVKCSELPFLLF